MQDSKMFPTHDQSTSADADKEPYVPPTVTVVPLKIEERLLACAKISPTGSRGCNKHPGSS